MKKNILLVLILVLILAITSCTVNTTESDVEQTVSSEPSVDNSEDTEENGVANIVHVTDDNFHDIVDNSEGVVLVDFWAGWCAPCLKLGPILEEISAEEGITIYKVDVDENPQLSNEFRISGIPTVYFYKDGQIVDAQSGLGDKDFYLNKIEQYS